MFDKLPTLPFDIIPELNEIARECEGKFMKQEFTAESGAGIVKVTVKHPGKLIKIDIDEKFFTPENKKLVEDLVPSAIERALETMNEKWREQLSEAQTKIQEIIRRFSENQESTDNQEKKAPGGNDENFN